jgi:hypothetical protein
VCTSDGLSFQAQAYSLTFGWSQSAQLTQVQQAPQSGVCGTANLDNDARRGAAGHLSRDQNPKPRLAVQQRL